MNTVEELLTSKIPPHSLEAERAVLGAIMLERESLPKAVELLRPQDFYKEGHRQIFATMVSLFERSDPVDLLILTEELRRRGELEEIGGAVALVTMVEEAATAVHLDTYAKIIHEKAVLRELIRVSSEIIGESYQPRAEASTLVEHALNRLGSLSVNGQNGSMLVRLSGVEPENVSWLWPGRIPRGKLSLFIGDPGLGKSFTLLDVAARISNGQLWPDRGEAPVGNIVLLTAEDGLADTVRPRFDRLGGDPRAVSVLRAIKHDGAERPFSLTRDLPALEAAITGTGAVLVVVDPLSAFLGGTDSYKDSEVRGVLAPLAGLAERHGVAVVSILHMSKDAQRRALYRAQGSIAFVAAARSVFAVAEDPEESGRRFLVPVKVNLAPLPPTLAFRITADGPQWEPNPVEIDAETALGGLGISEDRTERCDAERFLRELLENGEVAAAEVFKAAKANGIAERTLKRAKQRLEVRVRHAGQPGQQGAWFWSLPKGATHSPKSATPQEVAPFGEDIEEKAESVPTSSKSATLQGVAPFDGNSGLLRQRQGDWEEV